MNPSTSATRRVALTAAAAALTLGVAGCGSDDTPSTGSGSPAAALVLDDGWVKAVDEMPMAGSPSPSATTSMPDASPSEMGGMDMSMPMSAMFGTLRNTSDADITIEGGTSSSAEMIELHETVTNDSGEMQMQPKQGGFVVPAGGTYVLKPGGDHVMLMGLTGPLRNGAEATVTLRTSAGEFALTVPVRAFSGAEESYVPSPSS